MSAVDLYLWLKALHVVSALIFVGGIFSVTVFLAAASAEPAANAPLARAIRRWDRAVTTPAMLLVWAFGLVLALSGGWLSHGWLQAKLVLVMALSVIHGVQSGRLRRLSGGSAAPALRLFPLILGCVIGIAALAVVKPF